MTDEKQKREFSVNVNAQETPVLYTDNILMSVNEDGVVLDVCQRLGQSNQLQVVARMGMSTSHARKLVKQLGELLMMSTGERRTGKEVN